MREAIKLIIGIGVLILGFFIGNFIARLTKDELVSGQIYFKSLVLIGLIGGIIGLIIQNDVLLFSMFFISIVSSRSVLGKKWKNQKKSGKKN